MSSIIPVFGTVVEDGPLMWRTSDRERQDIHVGFRGRMSTGRQTEVEFRLCGASCYKIWIDGEYFHEGPDRFPARFPEYQVKTAVLDEGVHVIAVEVHYEGLSTRIMKDIPPFLFCKAYVGGSEVKIDWKCSELGGYDAGRFRISGLYGWVEWLDTRGLQKNWHSPEYDDSRWMEPVEVERPIGKMKRSSIGTVKAFDSDFKIMDEGELAEIFGYELDDPSARFFLRDMECRRYPPQGVWKRYDVGRIKLVRPRFTMDLPAGTVVEFAYCEYLIHDRVSPWINFTLSKSYHMDHFVARGGVQVFEPMKFKGGRFIEIHVLAQEDKVRFIEERFIERSYYDRQQGWFRCSDTLLDRIWQTGIDTYRSCAEDALTDTPLRERGQWLGDACIGMMTGLSAFDDIRICRKALYQFAQCAREDGMVAGLCPGNGDYLPTYAAQWVGACLDYWKYTGDATLLYDLYPYARANMSALGKYMTDTGISGDAGWAFIDWGYVPNPEGCDMGLNIHVYRACIAMERWCDIIGNSGDKKEYADFADALRRIISGYYDSCRTDDGYDWELIGYHRTVMGIRDGFIAGEYLPSAIGYVRKHISGCFPNNPGAPVMSYPGMNDPGLISPYFAHQAFPVLIDHGEMEFVMDQYRSCWGWMLSQGVTTWLEVFDNRLSNCHQWSGCPSWQLSRYGLGFHHRFDLGENHFDFRPEAGDLEWAEGRLPLKDGNYVDIRWKRNGNMMEYTVTPTCEVVLHIPDDMECSLEGKARIRGPKSFRVKIR